MAITFREKCVVAANEREDRFRREADEERHRFDEESANRVNASLHEIFGISALEIFFDEADDGAGTLGFIGDGVYLRDGGFGENAMTAFYRCSKCGRFFEICNIQSEADLGIAYQAASDSRICNICKLRDISASEAAPDRIKTIAATVNLLVDQLVRSEAIYAPRFGYCKMCLQREDGITENTLYCSACMDAISRLPIRKPDKCTWIGCEKDRAFGRVFCDEHDDMDRRFDPYEHCEKCLNERGVLQPFEPTFGSGNEMACPVCHVERFAEDSPRVEGPETDGGPVE